MFNFFPWVVSESVSDNFGSSRMIDSEDTTLYEEWAMPAHQLQQMDSKITQI